MQLSGFSPNPFRMVERSRFQTFAARLLPEPAGRAGLMDAPGKSTEGRRSGPQSLGFGQTAFAIVLLYLIVRR
jgi:hypothetical protein